MNTQMRHSRVDPDVKRRAVLSFLKLLAAHAVVCIALGALAGYIVLRAIGWREW